MISTNLSRGEPTTATFVQHGMKVNILGSSCVAFFFNVEEETTLSNAIKEAHHIPHTFCSVAEK